MKLLRRSCKRGRIEIIPMIDTILILLIFYMSFSTFTVKEKRMDAGLPTRGNDSIPEISLLMHVRNEREIVVNGATFDPASLRASLQGLGSASVPARIVIEAEADTPYQAIINVMDACAQAKLTRVAFVPLAS